MWNSYLTSIDFLIGPDRALNYLPICPPGALLFIAIEPPLAWTIKMVHVVDSTKLVHHNGLYAPVGMEKVHGNRDQ